jgi:phage tail protein X
MRTGSSLHRICIAATLASLAETPRDAAAFPYTAVRGDTLASVSERFYGRVELEKVVVAANGFENQVPLLPGMRVEIPAVTFVKVQREDSWESLAELHLGDVRRAEALALSNDSMPWIPPKLGKEIVLPYPLRVVAGRGDSTSSIAYRFLGKRDHGFVVDRFNYLGGDPVEPGDVLLVPVTDLVLTDLGREEAQRAARRVLGETGGEAAALEERGSRELPLLRGDVRAGRYVEAVARANQLLSSESLSSELTASLLFELVVAYVALDARSLAEEACVDWRRYAEEVVLDPLWVSPKVLAACAKAPPPVTTPSASVTPSASPVTSPSPLSSRPKAAVDDTP